MLLSRYLVRRYDAELRVVVLQEEIVRKVVRKETGSNIFRIRIRWSFCR